MNIIFIQSGVSCRAVFYRSNYVLPLSLPQLHESTFVERQAEQITFIYVDTTATNFSDNMFYCTIFTRDFDFASGNKEICPFLLTFSKEQEKNRFGKTPSDMIS